MPKGALIGVGRTAEVHEWDDDWVLKLYRDQFPLAWVRYEAELGRLIHGACSIRSLDTSAGFSPQLTCPSTWRFRACPAPRWTSGGPRSLPRAFRKTFRGNASGCSISCAPGLLLRRPSAASGGEAYFTLAME